MRKLIFPLVFLAVIGDAAAGQMPPRHRGRRHQHLQPTREPLSIRMLNPCALSYGYKATDPKDPSNAFWTSVLAGIPAAAGDKDNRGNTVMKFSKWSDGVEACRRFQRGPLYANLSVLDAIRRWDGGPTWKGYAAYVQRRTRLSMRRKMKDLEVQGHRRLIQAQAEWESGHTRRGLMGDAELSAPPSRKS